MRKRELKLKVNARVLARKARKNRAKRDNTKAYHSISEARRISRGSNDQISSTKIGAGEVTTRRSLPMTMVHKRNHRTTEMMGHKLV